MKIIVNNPEKHAFKDTINKYIGEFKTVVIFNYDDLTPEKLMKLRGYNIDLALIPKSLKSLFHKSDEYKLLSPQVKKFLYY